MSRYYNDELYHHGIKGMKWGVRRYQNANGSYTSAGKQRRSQSSEKKGLSDRQKTALKVGAAVVATGLAAYGAHKILGGKHNATTAAVQSAINKGKTATANLMKKAGNKAYNKAVSEVKKTPDRIKRAGAETKSAIKEGAKKGVRDGAKVVGSGAAIYAAQKALEKRYGKQNAEKMIQYGRQPLKKK